MIGQRVMLLKSKIPFNLGKVGVITGVYPETHRTPSFLTIKWDDPILVVHPDGCHTLDGGDDVAIEKDRVRFL